MAKGRLLLVRHGQSEGNAEQRFTSTSEVPITDLGRRQAREVAALIRHLYAPVRLVSSPFRRARQTAELIGQRLGLPVEIEPEVREQNLGRLHGRPYEAARSTPGFGEVPLHAWRPPDGETLIEVQARAVPALLRIAGEHPADDVIVVSHSGTMTAVWAHILGGWERVERIPNSALLVVDHSGERLVESRLITAEPD